MLTESIAVLAASPPPQRKRLEALADLNAEVAVLEKELNIKHSLPTLNEKRVQARLTALSAMLTHRDTPPESVDLKAVNARIAELETALGVEHSIPTSDPTAAQARLAAHEIALQLAPPPPSSPGITIPPVAKNMPPLPATVTEPDYLKMSAADRQQFCEDGGTISKQTFDALTPVAKMKFCKAGGKVEPHILKSFNTGNHS